MLKISILVPVYNVENYLRKCLDNLINQTLDDVETVCINDGSTGNSAKLVKECTNYMWNLKHIDKHFRKGFIEKMSDFFSNYKKTKKLQLTFLEKLIGVNSIC